MQDLSSLQVADILRKDFKKWTGQGIGLNLLIHFYKHEFHRCAPLTCNINIYVILYS